MGKDNQADKADILMSHNIEDNVLSASDLWPKNKKRKSENPSEASDTRPSKRARTEESNKIMIDTDLEITNSENIGNLSDSSDISSEMTGSQVSEEDSEVEVEILDSITLETNQLMDHGENSNGDKNLVLSEDTEIQNKVQFAPEEKTVDLLHKSERHLILKEEHQKELDELIKEYVKLLPDFLDDCLSLRDAAETIGKDIGWNEQKMEQPTEYIIASLEALMQLIEDNSDIYCLSNETAKSVNKDQMLEFMRGKISSEMGIEQDICNEIRDNFYEMYDGLRDI